MLSIFVRLDRARAEKARTYPHVYPHDDRLRADVGLDPLHKTGARRPMPF